jgi:hypothetical protein
VGRRFGLAQDIPRPDLWPVLGVGTLLIQGGHSAVMSGQGQTPINRGSQKSQGRYGPCPGNPRGPAAGMSHGSQGSRNRPVQLWGTPLPMTFRGRRKPRPLTELWEGIGFSKYLVRLGSDSLVHSIMPAGRHFRDWPLESALRGTSGRFPIVDHIGLGGVPIVHRSGRGVGGFTREPGSPSGTSGLPSLRSEGRASGLVSPPLRAFAPDLGPLVNKIARRMHCHVRELRAPPAHAFYSSD